MLQGEASGSGPRKPYIFKRNASRNTPGRLYISGGYASKKVPRKAKGECFQECPNEMLFLWREVPPSILQGCPISLKGAPPGLLKEDPRSLGKEVPPIVLHGDPISREEVPPGMFQGISISLKRKCKKERIRPPFFSSAEKMKTKKSNANSICLVASPDNRNENKPQ